MIENLFCDTEVDRREVISTLTEYSASLQHMPTRDLVDHLKYLVRIGDLIRVRCIRAAFHGRQDRHRYAEIFDEILAQLAFAESRELDERRRRFVFWQSRPTQR
jgi:hypothetical protein